MNRKLEPAPATELAVDFEDRMTDVSQDPCQAQSQHGSAGYPQPGPGPYQPPDRYPYPAKRRTNTMAILALVFAFIFAPAGAVLGVMARREIRRTGEDGWGLATAGMIVGIVSTALAAVLLVVWIIAVIAFTSAVHTGFQQNGAAALSATRACFGL